MGNVLLARGRRVVASLMLLALACGDEPTGREETGLESLGLSEIQPSVVVPGTRMVIVGDSFLAQPLGVSWLRLVGNYNGAPIDSVLPAQFVDFEHLEIQVTDSVLRLLGPTASNFAGRANVEVDFVPDGTRHSSIAQNLAFEVFDHLDPELDSIDASGTIYVNEPMEITGRGLLLGGDEGTTFAIVEGCFTPAGADACTDVSGVSIPLAPAQPYDREHAIFAFSPQIAGIEAGRFEGTVMLRNEHADGEVRQSAAVSIAHDLAETVVTGVGDNSGEATASLGRYVPITGGGFVSPDDGGLTSLVLNGTYFPDDGGEAPVTDLQVIPEFVDGRQVRYVVNEEDALAQAIEIRPARGTFVGQMHAITEFGTQRVDGAATEMTLRLEPVKQVVYVKFNPTYVESLRLFGVRATDQQIRARIFEVLRRDFAAINIEFRDEVPDDFKLYSTVEIAGPDPNGLGLLGYDNTPGKDRDNQRLDDTIGGVNAETLEDGLPGFGGVFMESLFTFSEHPPAATVPSGEVASVAFDRIFDPLRPDRGRPVSSADFAGAGIPTLDDGTLCPSGDRNTQVACAVFVLGSVVGSTVSHEIGHSLGLADPLGSPDVFHNNGDLEGRLMDAGSARSFEERAQLSGQGPSRFCIESYEYLRTILPTSELDAPVSRPPC